ncbi:MAG TPA: tRNA 2-thiouridine(34) synthase MnmA [Candidatus Paceibacterota bacterium]|nr:tRNA 2-thiouridine(34) synthase MnmA [Candidatus Paceibacterota bacterium]
MMCAPFFFSYKKANLNLMDVKGKKVFVGMSGGVDSSVSAALLKEQGYDVTGVFIRVWQPDFTPCDWREERRDAMRVAAQLDIPFKTYDFRDEYKKEVVDYMIKEYREGRTPNPDVMCNRYVKFGSFLQKAIQEGADFIATGHYVRNEDGKLLAGRDDNKDQSYFLWTLNQDDLKKIIFPIGEMEKPKVRKEAEKLNLHNANKKDSQGICFVGKIDVKEFLKNYIDSKEGNVLNEAGEVVGKHDGATFLTFGQRHGFTITKKTPNDKPYYVVGKNVDKNTIIVSNELKRKEFGSTRKGVEIERVNWISGEIPNLDKKYRARLRYRQNLRDCKVEANNNKIEIVFDELQENVTSGQSLVLYDGEICLGGGVIF